MCSKFVYVVLTLDSLARLWKFNYNIVMVYLMRFVYIKSHCGFPVAIQSSTYFLIMQYLPKHYLKPRLLVFSSVSNSSREG